MSRFIFVPSTFTASEAGSVSGLDRYNRKSFQRQGYIERPENRGWTRHSLEQIAKMLLMCEVRRLPPHESAEIADSKARGRSVADWIVVHSQDVPGAIHDPEHLAVGKKPIKVAGKADRFLLIYGASVELTDDITEALNANKGNSPAGHFLDLDQLARLLVARAGKLGKPLWTVEAA
jgi:hypothetical protein